MKKQFALKSGILTAALMALIIFPFSASAFAQSPHSAAEKTKTSPSSFQSGTHALEWGAFSIAAGEVAGLLGMGFSHMRQMKRQAAKKNAAKNIKPATNKVPLPYALYCTR